MEPRRKIYHEESIVIEKECVVDEELIEEVKVVEEVKGDINNNINKYFDDHGEAPKFDDHDIDPITLVEESPIKGEGDVISCEPTHMGVFNEEVVEKEEIIYEDQREPFFDEEEGHNELSMEISSVQHTLLLSMSIEQSQEEEDVEPKIHSIIPSEILGEKELVPSSVVKLIPKQFLEASVAHDMFNIPPFIDMICGDYLGELATHGEDKISLQNFNLMWCVYDKFCIDPGGSGLVLNINSIDDIWRSKDALVVMIFFVLLTFEDPFADIRGRLLNACILIIGRHGRGIVILMCLIVETYFSTLILDGGSYTEDKLLCEVCLESSKSQRHFNSMLRYCVELLKILYVDHVRKFVLLDMGVRLWCINGFDEFRVVLREYWLYSGVAHVDSVVGLK